MRIPIAIITFLVSLNCLCFAAHIANASEMNYEGFCVPVLDLNTGVYHIYHAFTALEEVGAVYQSGGTDPVLFEPNVFTCRCEEMNDGSNRSCEMETAYNPHLQCTVWWQDGLCVIPNIKTASDPSYWMCQDATPANPCCF